MLKLRTLHYRSAGNNMERGQKNETNPEGIVNFRIKKVLYNSCLFIVSFSK